MKLFFGQNSVQVVQLSSHLHTYLHIEKIYTLRVETSEYRHIKNIYTLSIKTAEYRSLFYNGSVN